MKAIVVRRHGPPEELRVEDAPLPLPRAGEVRLRVARAGVNFTDTERRSGRHHDRRLPFVPGLEAAGIVEATGSRDDAHWIGRRAAVMTDACYAGAVVARESDLMPLPDAVSFDQGAAFPIQGLTAYHALHTAARVRAGETVLVHAAAGGVGQWCVQLAAAAGARVLGTASSASKRDAVCALGASDALEYGPELAAEVRARTGGRGVDAVLDSVGRDTQAASLAMLAPFGRLVHFGTASGPPAPVDVEDLYDRSIQVAAYWLRSPHPAAAMAEAARTILDGLARGTLRAPATTLFALEEAAAAHAALESRRTQGKLLLRTDA